MSLSVALVHPYSFPEVRRGGERYLADEAWYLASRGHRVVVVTGTAGPSRTDHDGGVTTVRLPHLDPRRLRDKGLSVDETFGIRVLAYLTRHRFDVVHAYTPTAAIAARLSSHPTVYTVLGHPTAAAVASRPAYRRLFVAAGRAASVTVALSRASAYAAEEVFGIGAAVLSPGVRLDQFPARVGAPAGAPAVLFSATPADRRKRVDVALGALGELLARRPGVRLRISGTGNAAWALAGLADRRAPVEAATDLLGPGDLSDVPRRYREATVTLLPSEEEAFGLALVESLASGTPAVCADEGGMPEIIDDPAIGRVFPAGDVRGCAGALDEAIDLAGRPATAAACANHARRWGWIERIGAEHEALLAEVAGRRRRRRRG